ncbi:hypothetical protein EDB85DRAFT_1890214 [Lactarius pseudohatsudake]|nr:hypothetical protein EDB85DRAFT_1890214 [Lactarius pseudohatsudake]
MDPPQGPSDENHFQFQSTSPAITLQGNTIQQSIANPTYTNPSPQVPRLKCTLTEVDISTSLSPAEHSSTAKRARIIRPVPSRPMSLVLPSENEPVGEPENSGAGTSDCKDTDQGKKLQCTSSYYPGCGDGCGESTRGLSPLDLNDHDTDVDDPIETEEDWMGDEPVVKPTRGAPSKFAEAVANEQPSWQGLDYVTESILADLSLGAQISDPSGSASGSGQAVSLSVGSTPVHVPPPTPELTAGLSEAVVASLPGSTLAVQTTMQESAGPVSPWPANTDLVFASGSKKVMLTLQFPLVRTVLQNAFKFMRAYLVLTDAFPDATDTIAFARNSLITAAESHQSDAAIICK